MLQTAEVGAGAQQQGLSNYALEVTVLALNRGVLLGYAAVVPGCLNAIVSAPRLVTAGLVFGSTPKVPPAPSRPTARRVCLRYLSKFTVASVRCRISIHPRRVVLRPLMVVVSMGTCSAGP